MPRILEGIRIVDFTAVVAGPQAGALLGDLGAEVIHVEPKEGEFCRALRSFQGTSLLMANGKSVLFEDLNRNKKGIALNVKDPEGIDLVRRLVAKSDVFISNYRAMALEKLGLGYQSLRKLNPKLVYAAASAFGDEGPLKDGPAFELVGTAASGAMLAAGDDDMPPVPMAPGLGDRLTGYILGYGVIAALLARERLGIGQEVSTSQLGAMLGVHCTSLLTYLRTGQEIARHNRKTEKQPLYNWYRCKDDRWITFAEMRPQPDVWKRFCRGLGMPELVSEPRFADQERRAQNCEQLISIIDTQVATRTRDEWMARFRELGDFVFYPINNMADVAHDPQVLANDYIVDWEHPSEGPVKAMGFPVKWHDTPAELRLPAPEVGEHTEEILTEILGCSWDEVAQLKQKGVIN